jgi:hypothetical protein
MTDLRQASATLILGEALDGASSCATFVRSGRRAGPPYGRRIELGLEPGRYEVRVEREEGV